MTIMLPDPHTAASLGVAGVLAFSSLLVTVYSLLRHLRNYTVPKEQMWIVAILIMVPVYSIDSWISLYFSDTSKSATFIVDSLRNMYEAYCLYGFFAYCTAVLGGERRTIALLELEPDYIKPQTPSKPSCLWRFFCCCSKKSSSRSALSSFNPEEKLLPDFEESSITDIPDSIVKLTDRFYKHPWYLSPFIREWAYGEELYSRCKFGVVQYIIFKVTCSILGCILEPIGVYGDGMMDLTVAYPYISMIYNISQCWALYCLIVFYFGAKRLLAPCNPVLKFASIKTVVFFCWWQGYIINILAVGDLVDVKGSHHDRWQLMVQEYLVCIEMFFIAVFNIWAWSAEPYLFDETLPGRLDDDDNVGGSFPHISADEVKTGLLYDDIAPAESVMRQKQKPSSIKTSAHNAVRDATTQTAGDVTNGALHLVGIGGEAMLQPIRAVGRHFYKRQKQRHLENLQKLRDMSDEGEYHEATPPDR